MVLLKVLRSVLPASWAHQAIAKSLRPSGLPGSSLRLCALVGFQKGQVGTMLFCIVFGVSVPLGAFLCGATWELAAGDE